MAVIILFLFTWYGGAFFQSFFLHRYSAHRTFTMSKTAERITYLLTYLVQGSNYLSAYGYGIMHRMHHAYADTEKDPHSPKYDKNVFSMMWRTNTIYKSIYTKSVTVDPKFTKNVPEWESFEKFTNSKISRIMWIALYAAFFYFFATAWWQWLLLPIIILMAPVHGAIINWFAHLYGYVNFKVNDTSKNLLPFDFLVMGECYHNNHHKHGSNPNFGVKWHEFDPTYFIMRILNAVGFIKISRA
ncbi:acyl-CoA desaturase [Bacteroidota bacterium]